MAAEVDDDPPLSQNSELTSFHFFRQAGLDRRRPSKRQTTVRSFKIKTNWNKDGSSQAFNASSSQVSSSDLPITQEVCAIPPTPEQLHVDTSAASNSESPEFEPPSISSSETARQPIIPQDSSSHLVAGSEHVLPDPVQLGPVTRSRSLEESPRSIVLESPKALHQTDKTTDVERTPSPSLQKPLIEKTPLSGPGVLKTKRGRKRRKNDAESMADEEKDSLENEYQENNFVRLFNANYGRKSSMSEITDLDVILTAIEEEALDIRNEMQLSAGRQAIKEFFIQMRKSFSETIDVYKENNMLKSDLRKAKARINKLRKALLGVQQKRSRMSARLEKEKTQQEENNDYRQKVLEDFSSFLVKLEALQDELGKDVSSKEASKLDYGSFDNLPSLLMKGHGLLTAANQLKYINDTLQKKQ